MIQNLRPVWAAIAVVTPKTGIPKNVCQHYANDCSGFFPTTTTEVSGCLGFYVVKNRLKILLIVEICMYIYVKMPWY